MLCLAMDPRAENVGYRKNECDAIIFLFRNNLLQSINISWVRAFAISAGLGTVLGRRHRVTLFCLEMVA